MAYDQTAADLLTENRALRAFAQAIMECWPMGDLDGGALQDAAEKHGLLKPEVRHEDCTDTNGNGCNCAGTCSPKEWEDGVVCYRKTKLLLGHNVELTGGAFAQSRGGRRPERT